MVASIFRGSAKLFARRSTSNSVILALAGNALLLRPKDATIAHADFLKLRICLRS